MGYVRMVADREQHSDVDGVVGGDVGVDDAEHVAWVHDNRSAGPVVSLDAEGISDSSVSPGSLGGAVVGAAYLQLPPVALPMALAGLHRVLGDDAPAFVRATGTEEHLHDVCHGAGFAIEPADADPPTPGQPTGGPERVALRLRRSATLADSVGADMRLLLCGLNPSPASVEAGVGFARPGNRFWPAAHAAGLATKDRDPRHALLIDGLGMTDLVKRPTRTAAELTTEEYRAGLHRVQRLVEWLQPGVVCFIGLAGWRAAVDRKATAGPQPEPLGPAPVYLMPSTSGLNAHSQLPDLTAHLRAAADLAGSK